MKYIPKADLNEFLSGNSAGKSAFVNKIGTAFQEVGFLILKGHFLDPELQKTIYQETKKFFDLPISIKSSYENLTNGGQRGYTGFGKEKAKGRKVGDLKEFWHFGQDLNLKPHIKELYPKNIWVKELKKFNETGNLVFLKLEKTAKVLLQALALFLNLDEYYFDPFVKDGNSILRAIHYPPIRKSPEDAQRAAPHGDINLITLLMGAQGRGLQILNPENQWVDVVAKENELIINIGDMLSRLTNGYLTSTIHRVKNPEKVEWSRSRYSIPFFMHPIPKMPLNCLPQTVNEKSPKKYKDILAGDFLNQRLIALGLLKK